MAGDASGGIVKTGRCGLNLSVIESGAASSVDEQVSNRECDSVKLSSLLAAIAAMLNALENELSSNLISSACYTTSASIPLNPSSGSLAMVLPLYFLSL